MPSPTGADEKLAELEAAGKLKAVVTQNIDGLHQMAGSKKVLELHGSVHRNYCQKCGKFYDAAYMLHAEGIPRCSCGGTIKPDVVLYEEGLDNGDFVRGGALHFRGRCADHRRHLPGWCIRRPGLVELLPRPIRWS